MNNKAVRSEMYKDRGMQYVGFKLLYLFPIFLLLPRVVEVLQYSYPEEPGGALLFLLQYVIVIFLPSSFILFLSKIVGALDALYSTLIIVFLYVIMELTLLFILWIFRNLFFRNRTQPFMGFVRIKENSRFFLLRIVIRTVVKYLSIAFVPIALFFPFGNANNLFMHEIISGVCRVSTLEPCEDESSEEEEGGIVLRENFSSYDEQ